MSRSRRDGSSPSNWSPNVSANARSTGPPRSSTSEIPSSSASVSGVACAYASDPNENGSAVAPPTAPSSARRDAVGRGASSESRSVSRSEPPRCDIEQSRVTLTLFDRNGLLLTGQRIDLWPREDAELQSDATSILQLRRSGG